MENLPDGNQDQVQPEQNSPISEQNGADAAPLTPEAQTPPEPGHPNSEEAFAEFRRSLREEETREKTGFGAAISRFMQRLFRRKPAAVEEPAEAPSRLDGLDIPEAPAVATQVAEPASAAPGAPAEDEGADFRTLVRTKLADVFPKESSLEPVTPAPETLSEQTGVQPIAPIPAPVAPPEPASSTAASPRSALARLHTEDQPIADEASDIRKEALEDYRTEPETPDEDATPTLTRRLRRSWRDMRPLDRRLLTGALIIVALAVVAGSGYLVVQSLPAPTPTLTPTPSILPIPISISLPGGWVFPLSVGHVQNGTWNPAGAQWLDGTEVCRWISLPYSVQVEAVLRTLNANDEIKLSMSNYDTLTYKVESIRQVPASDVAKLASDTPSLLVILAKQDSDTRWVVTAKP